MPADMRQDPIFDFAQKEVQSCRAIPLEYPKDAAGREICKKELGKQKTELLGQVRLLSHILYLSLHQKVVGLIPDQGAYRRQLIYISLLH